MTHYRITGKTGQDWGVWEGDTPDDALYGLWHTFDLTATRERLGEIRTRYHVQEEEP